MADARKIPIACTLESADVSQRIDEWKRVLESIASRERIDGGWRLALPAGVDVAEVARLARAEQECCEFFAFALTFDSRGAALEVRAPDDAAALLESLFGV